MEKFYLVNNSIIETAYFSSREDAFKEVQTRNCYDRHANWKAYDKNGNAIYGIAIFQ